MNVFFTHVPLLKDANATNPLWFLKFSFDEDASSHFVGPIVQRKDLSPGIRNKQVASARFTSIPKHIKVGQPFSLEIQVATQDGILPMSEMTFVLCQSDYRPFYDPYAIGAAGQSPALAVPSVVTGAFYKSVFPCSLYPAGAAPYKNGCVDASGKVQFNLTLWSSPVANRPNDKDGFDLSYHVLFLISNRTDWPQCFSSGTTSPFCKFFERSDIATNLDQMCRLSGSYPDNVLSTGPYSSEFPEVVIGASTNHVSSKVTQPISSIRLDGVRTQQFDANGALVQNSEQYMTLKQNTMQKYSRMSSNAISKWGFDKFESLFLFYKILDDQHKTISGSGSDSRMTLRLLHVPER